MVNTLGSELPKEMARVREIIPLYDAIPTGGFAAAIMRAHLDQASVALAEGDLVKMMQAYENLKGDKS